MTDSAASPVPEAADDLLAERDPTLQVALTWSATTAQLTLVGSVDCFTEPVLVRTLEQVLENGALELVVDLHGVDFLGASGYWALAQGRARLVDRGGSLRVVGAGPTAARVAEQVGLDIGISV